ncbi:MAG TPA: hypothetical protein VLA49_06010 [Anaerolineales bacterium]|nr:hypothetical protein [Anaerolineales bacterium]
MKEAYLEKILVFHISTCIFYLSQAGKTISNVQFYEMDHEKWCKMKEIMLKLSEFRHNHHPSDGRMLAKFIRRGFSVYISCDLNFATKID